MAADATAADATAERRRPKKDPEEKAKKKADRAAKKQKAQDDYAAEKRENEELCQQYLPILALFAVGSLIMVFIDRYGAAALAGQA